MIAPRTNENLLHILSFGLLSQEKNVLDKIAKESGFQLTYAKDDLELWNHARSGHYDLCILGQAEEIPDPSYLIWLLKGLSTHSKMILIYSELTPEINERLKRFHASYVIERPIDPHRFMVTVESALNSGEIRKDGLWSSLSCLFSSRKFA